MIMRLPFFFFICFYTLFANAQSYRGMSVTGRNSAWISGSKGMVLRTGNGGKNWDSMSPKSFSSKDFRDIHAFSRNHAIILSSGDSGVVLETFNAGKTWNIIYQDFRKGTFLDALDVRGNKIILVGDGIPAEPMYLRIRKKKADSFERKILFSKYSARDYHQGIQPDSASSYFAASGSNIQWLGKNSMAFIPIMDEKSMFFSGNLQYANIKKRMPFQKQKAGGAYGFHMSGKNGVAVGGSFYKPNENDSVACYTLDGGRNWTPCQTMPSGYRSGVCSNKSGKIWICTGPNGTDYSLDGGNNWKKLDTLTGFNVCTIRGNHLWLAGKASVGIQRHHLKKLIKKQQDAETIRTSPRGIPPRY
jgi:hypothetical protein